MLSNFGKVAILVLSTTLAVGCSKTKVNFKGALQCQDGTEQVGQTCVTYSKCSDADAESVNASEAKKYLIDGNWTSCVPMKCKSGRFISSEQCEDVGEGFFSDENRTERRACPVHSSTKGNARSASIESCIADPGYYNCQSGECSEVGMGHYQAGNSNNRSDCPANSHTLSTTSSHASDCIADAPTYTPTFSSYAANTVTAVCSGTQIASRSIDSCVRDADSMSVATSFCTDPNPTTTYSSPSGSRLISVANGSQSQSCATGATSWVNTTLTCDANFHSLAGSCVADTYTPAFSSYAANTVTAVCSGTQVASRTIATCTRDHDSASVATSYCSDPNPTTTYNSPYGTRNVSIVNGQQSQSCSLGSTTWVNTTLTCDSNFHDVAGSCVADTFTPTFSSYAANTVTAVCSGTQVASRTIATCTRDHDSASVATTYCSDPNPTTTYSSPSGSRTITISNGQQDQTCAIGATNWVSTTLTCDSGYHDLAGFCVADTFTGLYSSYAANTVTAVCSGTQIAARTISSCVRDYDLASVATTYCTDPNPTTTYSSPFGTRNVSVANGTQAQDCAIGSTSWIDTTLTCDSNFHDVASNCIADTYTPTFSSYAANTVTAVCSGTQVASRTISSCTRDHDSASVATSFCVDSNPTTTYSSPSGSRTIAVSNGQQDQTCSVGATTWVNTTLTCDANFHDVASNCIADTYTPTFSSYAANTVTAVCSGTQIASRTIATCTRDHDSASVATTYCSDPNPTTTYNSPYGTRNVSVANGTQAQDCAIGATSWVNTTLTCDSNFHDVANNCIADTYTPTFSSYAANTVTAVCSGTQIASRTIATCTRDHDSASVATSFCVDPNPTTTYNSPYGTRNVSVSNGTQAQECAIGSTSWIDTTLTCDSTYHNTAGSCASDVIACTMFEANAVGASVGTRTWTGSAYDTCAASSCMSGKYLTGSTCFDVGVNNYQNADTISRSACPTHSSTLGATNSSSISSCVADAGWYNCDGGTCADTGAGFFNAGGTNIRTACSNTTPHASSVSYAGSDSHLATNSCTISSTTCSASYSENMSDHTCVSTTQSCAGTANSTAATQTWVSTSYGSCQDSSCSSGYYLNAGSCTAVGSGFYSNGDGLNRTSCPTNSNTLGATTSSSLNSCVAVAGWYNCDSGTCSPVGTGYFNAGGTNSRSICSSGSAASGVTNSSCTSCVAGTYQGSSGQASCYSCGSGTYSSGVGATSCSSCTNTVANASSVVYDAGDSGLTTNSCTISSVTCNTYYHASGLTCVADTPEIPSIQSWELPNAIALANSIGTTKYTNGTVTIVFSNANTSYTDIKTFSDASCLNQTGSATRANAISSGVVVSPPSNQTSALYIKTTNSTTGASSDCAYQGISIFHDNVKPTTLRTNYYGLQTLPGQGNYYVAWHDGTWYGTCSGYNGNCYGWYSNDALGGNPLVSNAENGVELWVGAVGANMTVYSSKAVAGTSASDSGSGVDGLEIYESNGTCSGNKVVNDTSFDGSYKGNFAAYSDYDGLKSGGYTWLNNQGHINGNNVYEHFFQYCSLVYDKAGNYGDCGCRNWGVNWRTY